MVNIKQQLDIRMIDLSDQFESHLRGMQEKSWMIYINIQWLQYQSDTRFTRQGSQHLQTFQDALVFLFLAQFWKLETHRSIVSQFIGQHEHRLDIHLIC